VTTPLPPKPIPPLPSDCCDSGCTTCVWTVYDEELQRWNDEVAALRAAAAPADTPADRSR
jgi:ferredoxin